MDGMMQCLCFDKAVHLRVELHSVNSNMFLKGFQTWKNQMAALESISVHIWAHTGINIDEMDSASNSATWRQEKVLESCCVGKLMQYLFGSCIFGMYQGRVRGMSGSCQGHVRGMSGACQGHVRGVSGACQGRVRGVSGACQGRVRGMSI